MFCLSYYLRPSHQSNIILEMSLLSIKNSIFGSPLSYLDEILLLSFLYCICVGDHTWEVYLRNIHLLSHHNEAYGKNCRKSWIRSMIDTGWPFMLTRTHTNKWPKLIWVICFLVAFRSKFNRIWSFIAFYEFLCIK